MPAFVGRDAELGRTRAALLRAADEQPSVLLLAGEAGVGKTTLLEQARSAAAELGFAVCVGGAVEGAGELTYASLRAAFRTLPDQFDAATVAKVAGRHPYAEVVLPSGLQGTDAPDAPDPAATAQCALELLGHLGEERPLLLALEDLHWADRSTLDLLSFVARNLGGERLLVLGTVRTDDLEADGAVATTLAELSRLRSVERLDLSGLDRASLRRLAVDVLGREPAVEELDDLAERCGGNPFYAVELLQARSSRPGELPPSVREVLGLRLARLPERAADVVGAASAVGPVADVALLSTALAMAPGDVERALRAGVDAGVLAVDPVSGEVRFRHALLREVAYAGLFASERTRLHASVAEAMAADPGVDPAVLAHHHVRAGNRGEALATSLVAARSAAAVARTYEAVAHYRRVAELWPDVDDAAERTGASLADVLSEATVCALGVAALDDGVAFAARLVELLDPDDDPERWGLAAARLSELRWESGDRDSAVALLERATACLEGLPPSPARVRVLERQAFHAVTAGIDTDGGRLAGEALAAAREVGDPELLAVALNRRGMVHTSLGLPDGRPMLWESFRLARAESLRAETVRSAVNLLMLVHAGGFLEEAFAASAEALAAADELEVPAPHRAGIDALHARVLVAAGRWDEASDVLAGAADTRYPRYRAYLAAARGDLGVGRGDGDEVRAALAELTFSNILLLRIHAPAIEAELALGEGRFHDVRRLADDVLPFASIVPETTSLRLCAMALHTSPPDPERYLAAGEEAAAHLRTRGDQAPADLDGWLAAVRAAHAEVVGAPCASLWADASAAFGRAGFPVRAAWADAHRAAALVKEGGDRDEAAGLAARAHSLAVSLGARPLREHVEDLVRRARLEVPGIRRLAEGDLGLTEREAEVLRLVAEGRTNREIADALFISVKTASVHVSNILRKVGATNRGEAAAVAHRHGLVGTA